MLAFYCVVICGTCIRKTVTFIPFPGGHVPSFTAEVVTCAQIHERMQTLRQQVASLDLIVSIYNNVQRTLTPIERPLLEPRLATVNATLEKGLLVSHFKCVCALCVLVCACERALACGRV